MDHLQRLDPEGYIVPEADLAKVQPAYDGLPRSAAGLLLREFGPRLHSGYLYGSIARGNAVPDRSDADLAAVLWASAAEEDHHRARRVEQALQERFPVLAGAGVALTDLQECARERSGMACRCSCGSCRCASAGPSCDRACRGPSRRQRSRSRFTATPPWCSPARARRLPPRLIRRWSGVPAGQHRGGWCRRPSRWSWRAIGLATVLEDQAAAVGGVFPRWEQAARRAAEQGRRPVAEPGVVSELLETFGRWAEEALAQIASHVAKADQHLLDHLPDTTT